jgi:hypothetical protein
MPIPLPPPPSTPLSADTTPSPPPSSSATSPKTPFPLPNTMNTLFRTRMKKKKKKKSSSFYSSLLQPNAPHNSRALSTPSPRATQMSTPLCLRTLLHGEPEDNDDEKKIIMRALEIWRKVTAEIYVVNIK